MENKVLDKRLSHLNYNLLTIYCFALHIGKCVYKCATMSCAIANHSFTKHLNANLICMPVFILKIRSSHPLIVAKCKHVYFYFHLNSIKIVTYFSGSTIYWIWSHRCHWTIIYQSRWAVVEANCVAELPNNYSISKWFSFLLLHGSVLRDLFHTHAYWLVSANERTYFSKIPSVSIIIIYRDTIGRWKTIYVIDLSH